MCASLPEWCWRDRKRALVQGPGPHAPQGAQPCDVSCRGFQVVEISSLTEHLLTECDKKDSFGECYRCSEAILKEELPRHIKTRDCNRECPRSPPRPSRHPQRPGWGVGGQIPRLPVPLPTRSSAPPFMPHRSN